MKKWRCTVCQYVHEGDTPPAECPLCGVGADLFEAEVSAEASPGLTEEAAQSAKKAIQKISYGLYIVTSSKDDKINGQVCNTVFQISSDPMTVAIGVNKQNLTREFILESGSFAVNILGIEGHSLVRRFGYRSGRELDKFKGLEYFTEQTKAPILKSDGVIAYLECKVSPDKIVDCGTHNLIVAEVIGGKATSSVEQMTYDYFRKTK